MCFNIRKIILSGCTHHDIYLIALLAAKEMVKHSYTLDHATILIYKK